MDSPIPGRLFIDIKGVLADSVLVVMPPRTGKTAEEIGRDISVDSEYIISLFSFESHDSLFKHAVNDKWSEMFDGVKKRLLDYGFIRVENDYIFLTKKGRKAKRLGSHTQYLIYRSDKSAKRKEIINSSIRTNTSVRKTNLVQFWSLIVTGIFIVVSSIYQVKTYLVVKSEHTLHIEQQEDLRRQRKAESQRVIEIQGQVNAIQKKIDSIRAQKKTDVGRASDYR